MIETNLIDAFLAVATTKSISKGAKMLGLTQPALSIRLRRLENQAKAPLFIRSRKGAVLTKAGVQFMRYASTLRALHGEFVKDQADSHKGLVRIAGHFSVIQYAVLPCIAPLIHESPELQVQLIVKEDDEIEPLLVNHQCDIALLQRPVNSEDYLEKKVGEERYVMAEKKSNFTRPNCFIDTDPTDNFSDLFFAIQSRHKRQIPLKRSYMYNVIGILTGVEVGLGRSIVFEPLVRRSKKVRIAPGYKPLDISIHLQCHKMSLFSSSIKRVFQHLEVHCKDFLR